MRKINSENFRGYTPDAFRNKGSLLEPVLLRSDVPVSPSSFHYWKLHKILPTIPDGKRAELSIVDVIWIEILKSMKNLGCSLKSMQAVHKVLFEDSYQKNYAEQNLKRNLLWLIEQEKQRSLTADELVLKESIANTMNDSLLQQYFRWSVSHLYTLVLDCIESRSEITIRLLETGKVVIAGHRTELALDMIVFPEPVNTYVQISLSDIVNRFFSNHDIQRKLGEAGFLSKDEQRVIAEMRNQNIRTLTIHFDNEEHTIRKIECDHAGLIEGEKARQIMKILGLKNYTGIELNTRDGQNLSFVRTEKKFFK